MKHNDSTKLEPSGFAAVERTRLSDRIAERIHNAITSDQYKPGERLPSEQSLAASFKTSRGTVREALRALQVMGVLDIRNGAGVFVTETPFAFNARHDRPGSPPDRRAAILEILEIRIVLQSLAVKRCAQRITPEELGVMQKLLREMHDAAQARDVERHGKLVEQFHSGIGDMCDNLMLRDIIHHIEGLYHDGVRGLFDQNTRLLPSLEEHGKIVDALARHDEAAAEASMHQHVQGIRDAIAALPDETVNGVGIKATMAG